MDCGPAALQIVSTYYGRYYDLEGLRAACHITREGVSLLGISEAAEGIGFKTLGGRFTFSQLMEEVPMPCILHWQQNHFVVLYKSKGRRWWRPQSKLYVADPAKGKMVYSAEAFKAAWLSTQKDGKAQGVALLLEPSAAFYQQPGDKRQQHSLKFLWAYFAKYKAFFVQLVLGLLLGSLLQLVFPFLTQAVVDVGIKNQNIAFVYLILLAQLMLMLSRASVEFIRNWILLHISTRINLSLVSDFFIKLMQLPMRFFDTKLLGDILQRINDHSRIERFLTAQSLNVLFSLVNFLVFGVVLLWYNIYIFLVFAVGSLLYLLWILIFLRQRKQIDYRYFEQNAKNKNITYQLINGMQEIKLQNSEQAKRWEWENVQADLFKVNISALRLSQWQEGGKILINESKNIFITIVAATAVIHGEMTLGMMLAVQYIIGQLNAPIEQSIQFIHDYQDARISLERINEIHSKADENAHKKTVSALSLQADIRLKAVSFAYEGPHAPKALDNISLNIPQGKVTAIVGASGSGKTTLVKLLLQYYNPDAGSIYVGEHDLLQLHTRQWRRQCGAVMQDGYIFSDSIARNIAVDGETIDKQRLLSAVQIACVRDYIEALPLKYNTKIGADGKGLSQGQRQRILIARAVYRNPHYIFLDEATNALDANNEKKITEQLATFYRHKTVVVVAHRLSTVKHADCIVVLHKGKIVEQGTHAELTAAAGAYYHLVKNQLELGK